MRYRVETPKLHECECLTRVRRKLIPRADCSHCGGTGATADPRHKKDWNKEEGS